MFEAKLERGEDVPFLRDRPDILPHALWISDAFSVLAQQRWTGHENTPQPIPISEILAYADLHGITDYDERIDLLDGIITMDDAAMKYMRGEIDKRNKKQAREAKAKNPRGGRRR